MKKSDSLRERAEKDTQNAKVNGYISESTDELVHELQVHQTELEIQNEELRDAQEELSELYNQYRELYDEAPVGYFSLDDIGNIRNVNIKGAELLGLEKNRIIGFGFIRFIPTNCQTKYYNSLKAAVVNHKIQEVELQLKRKKSLFYVQMQIIQIHNKPDEKYRIIITDINERKNAEEELKESEEKFKSLIKNLPVGISILDKERKILYDNPALENILELSKEDLNKEKHVKRKYIKSDMTEMPFNELPSVKAFNEQKPVEDVEIGVIKEDKSIIWTNVSAIPLSFPDWKVLAVTSNITRRKKLDDDLIQAHNTLEEQVEERTAELQTERDNLNTILNTTKSGVYIVNSDYELEYVNQVMKKDFGLIKGQKCYEYFYNKPDICTECKIQKAFEGNVIEWEEYSRKSNKTYDALATPIKTDGSISVVVFLYDVTRRENAEEQLKEAIQELERSNMELRSFAYITSHDLQEPLRTIGNYAGLIDKRYKGQLDCDADEFLDYMVSASKRMKDMIQGLLDYSRINRAGKEFIKTNMNVKLEKAIVNLQYTIDESKAEITHDELPTVISDQNQMVRVFQNLIGNAIKFKKPDKPPKIHISVFKDKQKNEYVFSVSDNGIGMETQYTNKIFEVFKRLHTIDEYEGTGIGLAIVKRIIERHGGRVWVESSFGVGSTFYFTIPIEQIKI